MVQLLCCQVQFHVEVVQADPPISSIPQSPPSDVSNMSISILMWKMIFIIYLPPVRTQLVPKLKILQIYWNLAHLIFQTSRSWLKIIFIKYLSPVLAQIGFKIKSAQKLLKFGTLNVSNMLTSILTSKFIFIKYLPTVWAQMGP